MAPPPTRRPQVVGVFPHPDDESWSAGALLAACARAGADVHLICATRGEAGVDRARRVPAGPALGALRSAELARAAATLGARPPRYLELPDGHVAVTPATRDTLATALDALGPDLVVTLGPDGGYGHTDHVATTALLTAALDAAHLAPRVLHAVFPRGLFDPVLHRLRGSHRGRELLAPRPDDAFGVDGATVDLSIDVVPFVAQKLAALSAHRSQLPDGDPHRFLYPGFIAPLLAREWFTLANGPALTAGSPDPLAGLSPP